MGHCRLGTSLRLSDFKGHNGLAHTSGTKGRSSKFFRMPDRLDVQRNDLSAWIVHEIVDKVRQLQIHFIAG